MVFILKWGKKERKTFSMITKLAYYNLTSYINVLQWTTTLKEYRLTPSSKLYNIRKPFIWNLETNVKIACLICRRKDKWSLPQTCDVTSHLKLYLMDGVQIGLYSTRELTHLPFVPYSMFVLYNTHRRWFYSNIFGARHHLKFTINVA